MLKGVELHSPREGNKIFSFLPLVSHEIIWMWHSPSISHMHSLPMIMLTLVIMKLICGRLQLSNTKEKYQFLLQLFQFSASLSSSQMGLEQGSIPVWVVGSSVQTGMSSPLCSGGNLPCRTRLLRMEGWICLPQCGGDCDAFSSPEHMKRVVTCPWNPEVLWSEEGLSQQKLFTHFCTEEVSQK